MPEIWGDLPKSQIDPSTVDEEIDTKIQTHLDDPDAHIETGQSLQSHKASAIIDHLASSIIEDKIASGEISSRCITSNQIVGKDFRTAIDVGSTVDGVKFDETGIEMWQDGEKQVDIPVSGDPMFRGNVKVGSLEYLRLTFQSCFESLDGFEKSANIDFTFAHLVVQPLDVSNDYQYLRMLTDSYSGRYPDMHKNIIFETQLSAFTDNSHDMYFGPIDPIDETGFGFRITSGTLRAVYFDQSNNLVSYSLGSYVSGDIHTFRIEFDYNAALSWYGAMRFYIDGVLVYTKDFSAIDPPMDPSFTFQFYAKTLSANTVDLTIFRVLFQQDL